MKQSPIKINFSAKTITLSKKFADAASKVGTEEYRQLQHVREDYPSFEIAVKQIKKNSNKESYQGLNYAFIEMYIQTKPNAEEQMAKYREMRLISECHSIRFPAIKQWFLATYPEIKEYGKFTNTIEKEEAPIAA